MTPEKLEMDIGNATLSRGVLIFRTSHQSGAMCGAVPSSVVGCLSENDKDGGETEDGRREGSSVSVVEMLFRFFVRHHSSSVSSN